MIMDESSDPDITNLISAAIIYKIYHKLNSSRGIEY